VVLRHLARIGWQLPCHGGYYITGSYSWVSPSKRTCPFKRHRETTEIFNGAYRFPSLRRRSVPAVYIKNFASLC
jgi:hypothetical protein